MEMIGQFIWINSLVAGLIALLAMIVGRFGSRPAIAHGLWCLALIKLITPPLFDIPIIETDLLPDALVIQAEPENETEVFSVEAIGELSLPETDYMAVDEPVPFNVTVKPAELDAEDILFALIAAWAFGAATVIGLTLSRTRRFTRYLSVANPASSTLESRVAACANRLNLGRQPRTIIVSASVSPLMWTWGCRPTLVLPKALISKLDSAGVDSLLLHELAHLKRRDHFVRLLELAVLVVYWWNPLVWWIRKNLRIEEEQCCDAWVVSLSNDGGRAYASALVDSVALISNRTALPSEAMALGNVKKLERRLNMILAQRQRCRLSVIGRIMIAIVAMMTLPWLPVAAQSSQDDTPKKILKACDETISQDLAKFKKTANEFYMIQRGDTLKKISKKMLGDAKRWKEIVKLNPKVDPECLTIGMKLRFSPKYVKGKDDSGAAHKISQVTNSTIAEQAVKQILKTQKANEYIVQVGDTLYSIAKKKLGDGKHWTKIANLNHIMDPSRFVVGQVIKIPIWDARSTPTGSFRSTLIDSLMMDVKVKTQPLDWKQKAVDLPVLWIKAEIPDGVIQGLEKIKSGHKFAIIARTASGRMVSIVPVVYLHTSSTSGSTSITILKKDGECAIAS